MNEQWTQDIRRKLMEHEQPAPELDWNELFSAVDAQRRSQQHRKTVVLWQRWMAAAVTVGVLAGGAVYLSHLYHSSKPTRVADITKPHPETTRKTHNATPQNAHTYYNIAPTHQPKAYTYYNNGHTYYNIETAEADASDGLVAMAAPDEVVEPASATVEAAAATVEAAATTDSQPQSVVKKSAATTTTYVGHSHPLRSTSHTTSELLTAKAYVSGALGNSASTSPMDHLVSSTMGSLSDSQQSDIANDATTGGYGDPTTWETTTGMDRKVKHHQPLRLGLSVRYHLGGRWSVDAGISYSHHTSDITETSGSYARYTAQDLTFIGIPVNAVCSLYDNRYVNIYAAAGGEVERLVKGKATTRTTYDGQPNDNASQTVKMSRPVFSLRAAAGAEVKLGQTFSVYAEPGLSYHFKNGAPLQTIYSDKPLNLSLDLGVRITLK